MRSLSDDLPVESARPSTALNAIGDRGVVPISSSESPRARIAPMTSAPGAVAPVASAFMYGSSREGSYPCALSRSRICAGVSPLLPTRSRTCAARSGRDCRMAWACWGVTFWASVVAAGMKADTTSKAVRILVRISTRLGGELVARRIS